MNIQEAVKAIQQNGEAMRRAPWRTTRLTIIEYEDTNYRTLKSVTRAAVLASCRLYGFNLNSADVCDSVAEAFSINGVDAARFHQIGEQVCIQTEVRDEFLDALVACRLTPLLFLVL